MSEGKAPVDVSFIVPTLNRWPYVLRTVDSCLEAGRAGAFRVQVIVLDSSSDDGSWEGLQEAHGGDSRVLLLQNGREGPTASWLAAAREVAGEFATFVWSDDYISRHFLQALLVPLISRNLSMAIGRAAVRPVSVTADLPISNSFTVVASATQFAAYVGGAHLAPGMQVPVSPACALFRRGSIDVWCAKVETLCRATPLRERLLWKAAIGPDLLLYLIGLGQAPELIQHECHVAQFSTHEESITVSSGRWLIQTGYWVARALAASELPWPDDLSPKARSVIYGGLLLSLCKLLLTTPKQPLPGLMAAEVRAALIEEGRFLLSSARVDVGASAIALGSIRNVWARRSRRPDLRA